MHFNNFDSMILGILNQGQGSMIAVEGKHRSKLRVLLATFARRLRLRLDGSRVLSHATATWRAMPVVAMCPSYSGTRRQRDQRTGVVETRPVGVNW